MLTLLKTLVILVLLGAIVGGAYGAYHFLIEAPRQRDARELAVANRPNPAPTPDISTPDFERAQALKRDRNFPEARLALEAFLIRYPDSSHHDQALSLLGDINYAELMDSHPGPGKVEYIVQRGDVLERVAHKVKSDAQFIYQANGLDRIMLRIGQRLIIPGVDFSIEVHLNSRRLVLLNHGKYFKIYPLQDTRPLPKKTTDIRTKIREKLATQDGRPVSFGTREFANSLRSLALAGQPGYTIYPISDAVPGSEKPPGSGLGLLASDAEELHSLVSVGTPVVITAR